MVDGLPRNEKVFVQVQRQMNKTSIIGLIIGIIITPFTLYLAVVSGGAGHGDYAWAAIFFPLESLMMVAGGSGVLLPFVFVQYAFYGWFIGYCISKRWFLLISL